MASRLRWLLVATLLITTACAGSSSSTVVDDVQTTDSASSGDSSTSDDAGCPAIPFSGTLSRSAVGGHQEVQRTDGEMVDAVAVARSEGIAYTIYLADYEIDADDIGATLEAPVGSVLVTLAPSDTDGIKIGQPSVSTENSFPFVIIDSGGGAADSAAGYSGQETVTGLSTTMICLEIDYRDDVKSIDGTVSARIVPIP